MYEVLRSESIRHSSNKKQVRRLSYGYTASHNYSVPSVVTNFLNERYKNSVDNGEFRVSFVPDSNFTTTPVFYLTITKRGNLINIPGHSNTR